MKMRILGVALTLALLSPSGLLAQSPWAPALPPSLVPPVQTWSVSSGAAIPIVDDNPAGKGFLWGAGIGAAFGLFVALNPPCFRDGGGCGPTSTPVALIVTGTFAAVGGLVGSLLGRAVGGGGS